MTLIRLSMMPAKLDALSSFLTSLTVVVLPLLFKPVPFAPYPMMTTLELFIEENCRVCGSEDARKKESVSGLRFPRGALEPEGRCGRRGIFSGKFLE